MKKLFLLLSVCFLVGCQAQTTNYDLTLQEMQKQIDDLKSENEKLKNQPSSTTPRPIPTQTPRPSSNSSSNSSTTNTNVKFTNKYGTVTTICDKSGCNNYISSSGDTHNCTTHSNKCLDCKIYIDGDATWCIPCIEKALLNN